MFDERYVHPFPRAKVIARSASFNAFISLVIILNLYTVGWESYYSNKSEYPLFLTVARQVIPAFFCIEFFIRLFGLGWLIFFDAYIIIDCLLIWFGEALPLWILEPLGSSSPSLRFLTSLRIARLFTFVWSVKALVSFRPLWLLVRGIQNSYMMLIWGLVMIFLLVYFFAIICEEVIGRNPAFASNPAADEFFGGLLKSMFSLFQIMTLSGWSQGIVRKVSEPQSAWWFSLMVIVFICLSTMILLNLLTAVMVESAFEGIALDDKHTAQSSHDSKQQIVNQIQNTLLESAKALDDTITVTEFRACLQNKLFIKKVELLGFDPVELMDLFDLFDEEDKGRVAIDELSAGLIKVQEGVNAKDVSSCVAHLKALTKSIERISETQVNQGILEPLSTLETRTFPSMEGDISAILLNLDWTLSAIQRSTLSQVSEKSRKILPPTPSKEG